MMSSRSCPICGAPLSAAARFCPACGAETPAPAPAEQVAAGASGWALPQPQPQAPVFVPPAPSLKAPATATTALLMGIMTWVLPFILIGFLTFWITAPLAVGCGVAARRTIAQDPERWGGSGQANTGVVLGMSALVIATLLETLLVFGSLA